MNADVWLALLSEPEHTPPLIFDARAPWLAAWLSSWTTTGRRKNRDSAAAASDFGSKIGLLVPA